MQQPFSSAIDEVVSLPDCLADTGVSALPMIVFVVLVAIGGLALLFFARKRTAAQRMTLLLIAGLALGGGVAAGGVSSSGAWAADSCSSTETPSTAPTEGATTPAVTPETQPPASVVAALPTAVTCAGTTVSIDLSAFITPSTSVEGVAGTIASVTWSDGSASSTVGQLTATLSGTVVSVVTNSSAAPVVGPWVFTYLVTDSYGSTATNTVTLSEPTDNALRCAASGGGGNNGGGNHGGGNNGGHGSGGSGNSNGHGSDGSGGNG